MKHLLYSCFLLLLTACAIQVAPTGGEKDIEPPKILASEPESGTTNFNEKEITLSFDEFVKLDRLSEQLVVSPPLKHNLATSIRGKRLILEIEDTLKESSTYVFNFGNAIVDIHENNPVPNYTYVFSTGSVIDSGRIAGRVIDAFQGIPAEKITVMAYDSKKDGMDSIPFLERPDYLAISNESGYFELNYLKEGSYKIFALEDNGSNYLFDKKTERVAFLEEFYSSTEGIDSLELYLFEEDHEAQYVKEQIEKGPSTLLIFNRELDTFSFSTELNDSLQIQPLLIEQWLPNDSILFWWPDRKERIELAIQADTLFDTLKITLDTITTATSSFVRGGFSKKVETTSINPLKVKSFGPNRFFSPPRMEFNYPIAEIDTSKLQLLEDDSVQIPFRLQKTRSPRFFILDYEIKESQRYSFSIDSAAFRDIYGHVNDSLGYTILTDEESDYGSLTVRMELDYEGPLILQLTDPGRKPQKEVVLKEREYTFQYLKSGSFSLKLILDRNGNGKWDTGNYLEGLQPEKVINYEGEIKIRNRWDKEVDWVIVE